MPTLSITTTTQQAQRVVAAYTDKLGFPATEADVKAALIDEIKSVVRAYEAKVAYASVVVPADVEPT